MSDDEMENPETQISLDFAIVCGYISEEKRNELIEKSEAVGRMLNHMIENPEKYKPRS